MKSSSGHTVFLVCIALICAALGAKIDSAEFSSNPERVVVEEKWKPEYVPDDKPNHLLWFIQVRQLKLFLIISLNIIDYFRYRTFT